MSYQIDFPELTIRAPKNFPELAIRVPKKVAQIKLCGGAMTFDIYDTMAFEMPTEEQRKNLKEMLCIEVIPIEED